MDYLRYSKIYKIAEKNGKGKEYLGYNNNLIFEGEYKNGKRNGIGIEYYYNINMIAFKGNYKNGMKNGKGKEYYLNGKLEFEGEYLKGEKMEKEKNTMIMEN